MTGITSLSLTDGCRCNGSSRPGAGHAGGPSRAGTTSVDPVGPPLLQTRAYAQARECDPHEGTAAAPGPVFAQNFGEQLLQVQRQQPHIEPWPLASDLCRAGIGSERTRTGASRDVAQVRR